MTNRFKISRLRRGFGVQALAAVAALMLAGTATAVMARQDPPPHGGPGPGPRMRGPGGPDGPGGPGGRMGPGGPMGGGPLGLGPAMHELDLTDDQKAQLKTIAESHRDEFREAGQRVGVAREAMRTLIEADQIDENAIRAKSVEVAAAEAEVAILNAKVRQQSMQVLTSEQQAKLKELRESHSGPRMRRPSPR